jgi:undecaprenyl-diphosphatase
LYRPAEEYNLIWIKTFSPSTFLRSDPMPEWIRSIDKQAIRWMKEYHNDWLTYNLKNVTALGSTTLLALIALLALGILLLSKQYKKALFFVVLVVGVYYATQGIKTAVARKRPAAAKSHSPSFPSSHASLSMAVFGMLAFCVRGPAQGRRRFLVFLYALLWALFLAVIVGLSRVYLEKHYFSDVVGGWLLGLVFVIVFYLASKFGERPVPHAA